MEGRSTQSSKASADSAKNKTLENLSDAEAGVMSTFLDIQIMRTLFEKRALMRQLQALTEECDALKKEYDYKLLLKKAVEREFRKRKSDEESGPRKQLRVESSHSSLKPYKFMPSPPVSKYGLNGHGFKFPATTISNGISTPSVTVKVANGISSFELKEITPSPPASEYERNGLDLSKPKATSKGTEKAGDVGNGDDGIFKVPTGFPYLPVRK